MNDDAIRLTRIADAWRRRVQLASLAVVAACGWGTGAVAWRAGGAAAALVAGAAAMAFAAWRLRARLSGAGISATAIARHLDRVEPALQDSTELLLADAAALGPLERLQRERVRQAFSRLTDAALPTASLRRTLGVAAAGLLLGAAALLVPAAAGRAARPDRSSVARGAPRLTGVEVQIDPPAYTGHAARRSSALDLDVEAGAAITWRATVSDPAVPLALVTSEHDTVRFTGDGTARTATLVANQAMLYSLDLGGARAEEFHRIAVTPDRPPSLVIVRPAERTSIGPADALTVPVEVLGRDDYGLASAEMIATVTTGSGEGVKFREQRLPFASAAPRDSGGRLWRAALDLKALGLAPGDELYFHVVAKDNRRPVPNEGRSETVFIVRVDTARVAVANLTGLALKLEPEYFRSERQIIIDTEKLLAEQPKLSLQAFRDRSAEIGIDQHLLRLRYGELVGDENEGGEGAGHADAPSPAAIPELGPHVMAVPDEFQHKHDTEDNATRLAGSIKATLKDALAQMWEAERYLRTYQPKLALPYEYRALELLKQVQQSARVYVKRVGFEPPPLEPGRKRLTGKQDEIRGRSDARERAADRPLPAVQDAIALLTSSTALTDAAARATLEAAGEAVARKALDEPGRHLELLGTLRRLLREPQACAGCRGDAAAGLLRLLPPPAAAPVARERLSPEGRAYLDRLRAGR